MAALAVVDDVSAIEMKQSALNEGGAGPKTVRRNGNGYNLVPSSTNGANPQQIQYVYTKPPTSTKCECLKLSHQILLHLVIIYCVVFITYVTFIRSNKADCMCSSQAPEGTAQNETVIDTTAAPSIPGVFTTLQPSVSVPNDDIITTSTNVPKSSPSTNSPTQKPSFQPTVDYSAFEHYIGDFKISAQNSSHGNWLLCDGSFNDPNHYPELFNIIRYSFGSQISGTVKLFALPNATDRVVGVNGDSNPMGISTGTETITLSVSNLPSHSHYLVNSGLCTGSPTTTRQYLSRRCHESSGLLINENFEYDFEATASAPNQFRSQYIGSGTAVNIIQPTVFVGNLFIYAR